MILLSRIHGLYTQKVSFRKPFMKNPSDIPANILRPAFRSKAQ